MSQPSDKKINIRLASAAAERALVLGGGGSLGNAWVIGVIAGLFDAGLNVTNADLTIGTSSGSTAAAQIAGTNPTELFASILDAPAPPPRIAQAVSGGGRDPAIDYMQITDRIIAASRDAADMRRMMGAAALEIDSASYSPAWRVTVASRLPIQQWPESTLLITAVNARTGEGVTFDRHSGVDLADAIAASCSSASPYHIGNDRYIDGGYRRNENADLAAGNARVLVLSPFGGRTRHPLEWGMQLAAQVDELHIGGSRVETIFPNNSSLEVFGDNMMDILRRPSAAQAGYDQGKALVEQLTRFWG